MYREMSANDLLVCKGVHSIVKQNHQNENSPNVHQQVHDGPTVAPPYSGIHTAQHGKENGLMDMTTWIILANAVSRERNQTQKRTYCQIPFI